ncbi:MAG: sensor histidine kinase [Acetivibrionales bacterium]|jgi:two-component system sensor histidine kinase YesM
MFKIRTIRSKLFIIYSLLILAIIITFITAFYIYASTVLKDGASESIQQASKYVCAQIDEEIKNMDRAAKQVIFSNSIKEDFFRYCSATENDVLLPIQRDLYRSLYSILGPSVPPIRQINIFNLDGCFIGIGNSSSTQKVSAEKINNISWIKNTIKNNGKFYVSSPHIDDWGDFSENVISLSRTFADTLTLSEIGIVEVQQHYSAVPRAVNSVVSQGHKSKRVFIYDAYGTVIYPLEPATNNSAGLYWDIIQSSAEAFNTFTFSNPITQDKEIIVYTTSDYSGWIIAVVEPQSSLLSPVTSFRNILFLAGIAIILMTLLVSFFVAQGLSIPIKRIHQSIKSLNLETLAASQQDNLTIGLNELEELNIAFRDMRNRLEKSLAEAVSSRSHEIQARMLALQSKMNPHFLYNTIATISIMAEKNGQEDIVQICQDLSGMLRYILSETSEPVRLIDEITYTKYYLSLMSKRYKDNLQYFIDIQEEMKDIKVPKLIIQPLVENWIKYGIDVTPPWKINIKGRLCNNIWEVCVFDNGKGFSHEKLSIIRQKLSNINTDESLNSSNLKGIGLINIYARLKLLYGDNVIFDIYNLPDSGAVVRLGGIARKEEMFVEK